MKIIKLTVIGIICLTLFGYIQSCSDNGNVEYINDLDIPKEYTEVGILHNEGLEYAFEELKMAAIEYTKKPQLKGHFFLEDREEFAKQVTLKFCEKNKKLKSDFDLCKNAIEGNKNKILLKSDVTINNPVIQQLLDEIKIAAREIVNKNDMSIFKAHLDMINRKAANTLSEQDAVAVYCATSTAYASYQYWLKNYRKWYFAVHYPEILEQYSNDELNQLVVKNGHIKTKGLWDDLWGAVEDWWSSTTQSVIDWWNDGGEDIFVSDLMGAYEGSQYGIVISGVSAGTSVVISAVGVGVFQSFLAGIW
jgi:hypothetical protein